jgi:tetratricopeptide (TPR) repeat protein
MILVGAVAKQTNLQPIQADIVYKQADPYDRQRQWQLAIPHYEHAIELTPKEDFYYLYLGRARLELASSLEDPAQQEQELRRTEQVLIRAREINPLNTDHSANLARMYRRWADITTDEGTRQTMLQRSSENYDIATTLSPQNIILWNEWAMLYYYGMRNLEAFDRTLEHSLELDPGFEQTWLICGDTSREQGEIEEAIECYQEALDLRPRQPQVWRVLADTYIASEQWEEAIDALEQVVEIQPKANDIWNIHQVMAQLYLQMGEQDTALEQALQALEKAPEDQKAAIQTLITQIEAQEVSRE